MVIEQLCLIFQRWENVITHRGDELVDTSLLGQHCETEVSSDQVCITFKAFQHTRSAKPAVLLLGAKEACLRAKLPLVKISWGTCKM